MEEKQNIKCDVHDCKHCDCDKDCCSLESIKVSNCGGEGEKETTMCNSYDKRNSK